MPADDPRPSDPEQMVADVLVAPEESRDRLPALLGLLDVGDRTVRLGSIAALCSVATEHPSLAGYLVRRLLDRTDGDGSLEVDLTLAYLAARSPEAFSDELDAFEAAADTDDPLAEMELGLGQATVNQSPMAELDVGRTELPGSEQALGPGRVHVKDDAETAERIDDDAADATDADEPGEDGQDGTIGERPTGGVVADETDWLSLVEYDSLFDRLTVLAPPERGRYSDSYRTLGVSESEELGVDLRLVHGPVDDGAFVDAIESRLQDWHAVSQTDNVVTLYDWNTEPRLWAATEYTAETLADRGRWPIDEALWHAEKLATAVSTLHERGVVHAGIDPENVSYYGNVLEEDAHQPPLLDGVGLLHVLRYYGDPSMYLDPRYAAPEYYERRFGRVDHATDIYQLGAVCYRLVTGTPPYGGDFEAIREQALNTSPPTPSDVADVPDAVDDVVGKAMAKQKLARYESAAHLAQELRALRKPHNDNGG